jgi:hypothetical protein
VKKYIKFDPVNSYRHYKGELSLRDEVYRRLEKPAQ